jgi:hypothetical protein
MHYFGKNKGGVMDTIIHMEEYHAINPEEMTTCMRLKIRRHVSCTNFTNSS